MNTSINGLLRQRLLQQWAMTCCIVLLSAIGLNACSGGSSSSGAFQSPTDATATATAAATATASACTASSCGSALLSLTDAQGDFLSYAVDVLSIKLQRADGTVVETLPVTTRVDFATLVNLTEIISNGQLLPGNYTSASITLDYSNASIVVDNGSASGLMVAPVDANGAAITTTTLSLQLDNNNPLAIRASRVSSLALDFNLLASNTVNLATAQVTVNPILVATYAPATTKQLRARGALVSVSATDSTYTISMRPFQTEVGALGQSVVHASSTTTYSINGASYSGNAGLTQLATLPTGTLVVAYGVLATADNSFTASMVLAGSSVQSTRLDSIEGDVIARTGNVLTVRGATLERVGNHGVEFERGDVSVTVGAVTAVSKDGITGSFGIQDISVGQHATFFGVVNQSSSSSSAASLSNSSSSSSAAPILFDATTGSARLMLSSLWGTVNSAGSGLVTVNLQALDGRAPTAFNFAGTGTSSASDALAAAYVVSTHGLDLTGVTTNTPARFLGFVAPFGSVTPGAADFNAETLINYAATNANLLVNLGRTGVTTPFATLGVAGLTISQSVLTASLIHSVAIGPQRIDLSTLASGVMIAPDTSASSTQYVIGHRASHKVNSFSAFGDFVTALTTDLNGTTTALGVAALGPYNATTGVLTAAEAIVVLND